MERKTFVEDFPQPQARDTFARIADFLLPAHGNMPAATAVGVAGKMLDEVLRVRPDLAADLDRALALVAGKEGADGIRLLFAHDTAEFNVVCLAVFGGYYMAPTIRALLGYAGQTSVPLDSRETDTGVPEEMLARVIARGSVFRPAPS